MDRHERGDEDGSDSVALLVRLSRLETQRNGAAAMFAMFALFLVGGALNVDRLTTRLDERVSRLTQQIEVAATAVGRIDRMEERINSMSRAVDRIDAEIPRVRESLDALRSDISRARAHASTGARSSAPHRALGMYRRPPATSR